MKFTLSSVDFAALQALAITWGGRVISALLILLIGKWIAERFLTFFVRLLDRSSVDVTLTRFLNNVLYYTILAVVIIAAASQLGINTASFLTIIGAASLAVGLALKDSLGHLAAGVMLILFRPFRVGDVVTVGGETGLVQEITLFNTVLVTADNQRKIIPNNTINSGTITNINVNPTRRIDLVIGIGYADDILLARETLETILAEDDRILKDPAPVVAVAALSASSVDLAVRPWVRTNDYQNVHFDLLEKIKLTFDEKKISFPYPQTDVHLYTVE